LDVFKTRNDFSQTFFAEDKQDDEEFIKDKLNKRLIKLMKDVNVDRMKETQKQKGREQKEKEQKEKEKKDVKNGKKKKKLKQSEDIKPNAPQEAHKFGDKEREIHEAYQVLLAEYFKRKQHRKRQARIDAIREKEANAVLAAKSCRNSNRDLEDLNKVIPILCSRYLLHKFK
jgi:hypothetical protein